MPADDLADGAAHLSIPNGNDASNPSSLLAETRLQHEAQDLQRQRSLPSRTMRDVTEDFIAACEQLRPGELIKDEYFTLFEAVGALEIMDPKMDSGFVPPGDSFEPEFDVCATLSPSQILWIMDEIFRLEMSLHDGYPLAQNLYTSLHIFDLIEPEHKRLFHFGSADRLAETEDESKDGPLTRTVLWAYCVAVVKCLQPMLATITNQSFYEEEDFVSHLFGRELLPKISHHEARKYLVEAMDWLDDSDIDPSLKYAIKYRLICREDLLFSMDKSEECWGKVKSRLDARTKDGTNKLSSHRELSTPVPEAFSNKVTRQLATSTPPRPMPQLSWEDALAKWVQMCDDILAAQRLTSPSIREIPHALQRATWAFAYRNPEPNTFARAKMQDILCADDTVGGDVSHMSLMLEDMRELHLAGDVLGDYESFQVELPNDPRHKSSRLIQDFIMDAGGDYVNLYRVVCQNRCRLRRRLSVSIGSWIEIVEQARQLDKTLRTIHQINRWSKWNVDTQVGAQQHFPISTWAQNYRFQIETWVVSLGFETDLYLPREMSFVYAYIHHLAYEQKGSLIFTRIFNIEKLASAQSKRQQRWVDECQAAAAWIDILDARHDMHMAVAMALAAMYAALERLQIIDTSPKAYEDPQLQFEARMKSHITGLRGKLDFVTEDNLRKFYTNKQAMNGKEVFPFILDKMKTARAHLASLKKASATDGKFVGTEEEWKAEIKKLERTCISISVEASKLEALCKKHDIEDIKETGVDLSHAVEVVIPIVSERYHVWWVVPQIREKKI